MTITGTIQDYDGETLTISAPFSNDWMLQKQGITRCEIRLDDGRRISADQRKRIYATFRDISLWSGHTPEEVKEIAKCDFLARTGSEWFSLSTVDMTTARLFLNYLIDFCIQWDIPTQERLLERSPDTGRYLYSCLIHKKCCITGRKAELHHCDAVGMGRDRREITHKGMRALPLCRKLHTEAHTIGQKSFEEKYHVFGIRMDDDLCRVWRLPI